MSAETIKTTAFDPQLLTQLLADRKTLEQIEDLRKAFIEQALEGELTDLLGYPKHHPDGRKSGNSRNGFSRKTVKTDESEIEVNIPQDRNAEFKPQLIANHQKHWDGFNETILALYALGMSTRDIQSFLQEKYEIPVSPEFIFLVCDSVSEGVQQWRTRPLANICPRHSAHCDGLAELPFPRSNEPPHQKTSSGHLQACHLPFDVGC